MPHIKNKFISIKGHSIHHNSCTNARKDIQKHIQSEKFTNNSIDSKRKFQIQTAFDFGSKNFSFLIINAINLNSIEFHLISNDKIPFHCILIRRINFRRERNPLPKMPPFNIIHIFDR